MGHVSPVTPDLGVIYQSHFVILLSYWLKVANFNLYLHLAPPVRDEPVRILPRCLVLEVP